jgi:16S rRNA processing protein RimM
MKPEFSSSSVVLALTICALAGADAFVLIQRTNYASLKPTSSASPPTKRNVLPRETADQEEKRRTKKNKYANFSKTDNLQLDPFEELLNESEKKKKELERDLSKKKNQFNSEEEAVDETTNDTRERNKRLFPDNKTIDPYDPTTYGYTEIGTILGAHGVHGLLKIAAVTEFAERLCKPGIRHLKAINRRSPREIRLLEGRHRMKNEYLIRLEGISDRNEAMKLRGSVLYARQEERPEDIGEDEYLISELVGLDVRLVTGYGEDDIEETFMDDPIVQFEIDLNAKDVDDDDNKVERVVNDEQSVGGKFVGTVRGVVLAEEMCSIPGLGQDLLEVTLPRGRFGTPSWKDEMVLIPLVPAIVPTIDIERGVIYIDPPGGLLDLTYVKEENVRIKGFLPAVSSFQENRYK